MSRMAEQFEHQQEQENLSGMSDYLHHTYTQSGVKSNHNTKELNHEHLSTNTRRIGYGQDNEPAKHEGRNNSANSSGQEASSVPF